MFCARNPGQKADTPREDGTVRLLWVCPFSRPECGHGFGATNFDQRTLEYMTAVLAVVVSSVLLLWLLLVLFVVVAVVLVLVVVVVANRSMFSLRGGSRFALHGSMQAIGPASWLRYNQFDDGPPHPIVAVP